MPDARTIVVNMVCGKTINLNFHGEDKRPDADRTLRGFRRTVPGEWTCITVDATVIFIVNDHITYVQANWNPDA